MLKKFLCIITVISLLGVFCVTSFAQAFIGDFNQISNDRRLWSPERITYLQSSADGTTYQTGTVYEVSPRYAINSASLPQTTYVNISGANTHIDKDVPSWMRYLYHSTRYLEAVEVVNGNPIAVNEYTQSIYLSRRGQVQTTDIVYLQVDIPRFFVDLTLYNRSQYADHSIRISSVPTTKTFPFGYRVEYAVDNGVGVEFKTLEYSEYILDDHYTFSLESIIEKIQEKMEREGDSFYYYGNNRILINKLSVSGYSEDGHIVIKQDFESGVRMVGNQNLSVDNVTPNFLNSMAGVITDFFSTTLFEIGSYEVSLGVVFALPFVICILFVFLRKFAGG